MLGACINLFFHFFRNISGTSDLLKKIFQSLPINIFHFQLLQQLSELGSNLNIIAFHPTDKTKSSKASQKESDTTISTTTNAEDPLSDDEMEEEYRSLLIRKQDQKNTVEDSAEDSGSSK